MTLLRVPSILCVALVLLAVPAAASDESVFPPPSHEAMRPDPTSPTPEDLGLTAPLVEVDRFSDAAGTLLRRSADPSLPGPNEPFSLDDPRFALAVGGPGGETARCYNLDIRPAVPKRYFVFYDRLNNYRLGQFPVIEAAPGDSGYSDVWDIWKIVTPDTFRETNWVRDAATVERLLADPQGGFHGSSTGIYLNAPVVPEGTTAGSKAEGREGSATMLYAWYRGKRAPFLYFEGSLHLDAAGKIPVAHLRLAPSDAAWPPHAPLAASAWPRRPGYSPLAEIVDASGKTALAGTLNCPIVGTAGY